MTKVAGKWYSTVLCVWCGDTANTVDHIVSHGGDDSLFWDESNLQPLCARCHGAKSMHERFGITYPDLSDVG